MIPELDQQFSARSHVVQPDAAFESIDVYPLGQLVT